MTLDLMTKEQLREALNQQWPRPLRERAFREILRRCPKVVIPGTRWPLYNLDAVLGWIRQQVVPAVPATRPETSLHRSRARKSA